MAKGERRKTFLPTRSQRSEIRALNFEVPARLIAMESSQDGRTTTSHLVNSNSMPGREGESSFFDFRFSIVANINLQTSDF